jgi:hypothetical protein
MGTDVESLTFFPGKIKKLQNGILLKARCKSVSFLAPWERNICINNRMGNVQGSAPPDLDPL